MVVYTDNLLVGKLTPTQEIKLSRSLAELSVGQLIKAVVVNRLSDNQVVLGINGQSVNAKTNRPYFTGEVINVKVVQTGKETVLEALPTQTPTLSKLQTALAQTLPRQWPATQLLATLHVLGQSNSLPAALQTKIQQLMSNFVTLNQLPQQLALALYNSGYFYESKLLKLASDPAALNKDFKGQLIQLIKLINENQGANPPKPAIVSYQGNDSLPLSGAIAQAHHRQFADLQDQSVSQILSTLQEQAKQVVARIQSSQINQLLPMPNAAVNLLLELPVQVADYTELVSFLLSKNSAILQPDNRWSIQFAVHLSELGDIQAKVTLQNASINIEFHVEKQRTINLLSEQHQAFSELLQAAGMQLSGWEIHHGLKVDDINTGNIKLLDIRV